MFYTIYRTTNLLNGKFYIGKHQTKSLEDGYLGSGKLLLRAVKKYGAENFITETIAIFDNVHKMNLAERILAVVDREMSYNLCAGGEGGFGFINNNKLNLVPKKSWGGFRHLSKETLSIYGKRGGTAGKGTSKDSSKAREAALTTKARNKRKAAFARIGHAKGKKNSQFGTIWITDGLCSKKIAKPETIPNGWKPGRMLSSTLSSSSSS